MGFEHLERIVPDTSVIIEGVVSRAMAEGTLNPTEIFIHNAVVDELEHQANSGHETGYLGLEELKRITTLCSSRGIPCTVTGPQPGQFEIDHAKDGAIDDMIRQLALAKEATLLTADRVQRLVAEAIGVPTHFIEFDVGTREGTALDQFFSEGTMSVHLLEDARSVAKVGRPGGWRFEELPGILQRNDIQAIAKSIVEQAGARRDSYIETERKGSTIVQLGPYRTVIAKPPFASKWEITAVRPVAKLGIEDYQLSEKLKDRLSHHAEGVLIAGSPGEGKSTFVQALAAMYAATNKIVKTIEAPRDLVVPAEVTQYSLSHASGEEIRDVLLLNRPDYTVFDEMRNTNHFQLYADLRLSGVGMVGVMHATKAIDAIQRFIGRIELGVIPHVVDTVLFIKAGAIQKTFSVSMQVKVPSGMTEADLARPIVVISDFETEKAEYEVYTYGEQTVVIPVADTPQSGDPTLRLASQAIREYMLQYADKVVVEMPAAGSAVVYVPKHSIGQVIGQGGKTIQQIEADLGIKIDVRDRDELKQKHHGGNPQSKPSATVERSQFDERPSEPSGTRIAHDLVFNKKAIVIEVGGGHASKDVNFYDGAKYLLTATVNKKGQIIISRDASQGAAVMHAVKHGDLRLYA